ncbi:MAG TPA: deoxyribose-phosphate aldolase [Bacillota bacterium]|nr:deoxyribose-phosphate aldolase [Bacillota bacterium]
MNNVPLAPQHPEIPFNSNLAGMIDHTLLKPDATAAQINTLCQEALNYRFASVCVNPYWVPLARHLISPADTVKICTVIGFPLGANTTDTKVAEAQSAINAGATEIDMVINISALKDGDYRYVEQEIAKVVQTAKEKALVKVILETCYLNEAEKIKACEIVKTAGANFVKTSTGFGSGGATVADITLMRQTVGTEMGVKASGGIRDYATAAAMIQAGASRIGTSSGIQIVRQTASVSDSNY